MFKMLNMTNMIILIIAVTAIIISIICMNKKCDKGKIITKNDAENFILKKVIPELKKGTKPSDVASLFSQDAVLFATLSNQFRIGRKAIEDYFNYFLTDNKPEEQCKKPCSEEKKQEDCYSLFCKVSPSPQPGKIINHNTLKLADNLYLINVFINLTVSTSDNKSPRNNIVNRMSFVVEYKNNNYRIKFLHASILPPSTPI